MGSVHRAALRWDQEWGRAEQWGQQAASSRGMGATGPGSWDLAVSLRESSSRLGEVCLERSALGAPQASSAQGRLCPLRERRSHRHGQEQRQRGGSRDSVGHSQGQAGTAENGVETVTGSWGGCSPSSREPSGPYFCMSHCRRRTMEGSLFAASLNSSREIWSSLSLSILVKILSTRCWGVSPSWFMRIMITVPTIL